MHIEITIHCPELAKLADALQAKATPVPYARTQTEAPAATLAPAPTASPSASAAPTAAPQYTLEQITKAGADLVQAGRLDQLQALLTQYGVQAVTQIPPEQYGAFATALRGLGAAL